MPATLDIVTLRSLVAVAQCGGFHKAARALHLTQAAVSRHVQRLEDVLGAELIVRDGRTIRFTPAGERFLTHAAGILEAHDAALADFANPTETLSIGAMDHAADVLLPDLVHRLREALPHRTVQVRLGRSARLREAIDRNQIDAAIVLQRITSDAGAPGALATRWVGGRALVDAPRSTPVPLVLFDHDCGLRRGAVDALAGAGLRFEVAAESPDLTGIHAAVRSDLGFTLLPALGRLPDSVHPARGLPAPPHVVMGIETASHVPDDIARTIRGVIEGLLASAAPRA